MLHRKYIRRIVYLGGSLIATASEDGAIKIIDIFSRKVFCIFKNQRNCIFDMIFIKKTN
jgi:hypothetical protein